MGGTSPVSRRRLFADRLGFYDDRSRLLDKYGWLLLLIAVTITLSALVNLADAASGRLQEAMTLLMLYSTAAMLWLAMSASGVSRRWRIFIAIGMGLALAASTLTIGLLLVSGVTERVDYVTTPPYASLMYILLAFVVVVRRLLVHRQVTRSTLLGAVAAYLLLPLWFANLFQAVNSLDGPFFGTPQPNTTFMYYSLTTLTTLGSSYEPKGDLPRLLTATEALVGQLFLVTFVAMIVGLMATRWRSADQP
jgi:Ion channel